MENFKWHTKSKRWPTSGSFPGTASAPPSRKRDLYDWQRPARRRAWTGRWIWSRSSPPTPRPRSTHRAVRRTSDSKVLGVVGPRYAPLQNQDAFDWFQPFLDAKEAALHTAGSLRGGSRIWVLAKLNRDPLVIAQGDEVEKFILLSHGHDGSLAVRAGFTPIRVVCQNTLSMAHGSDASKLIRVKHTKDVLENLANIREVMDLANAEFEATAEQYRLLARKSINQADLRKYVKRVLKVEDEEGSTRSKNIMEEIVGLAEAGRGNDLPSVRGTSGRPTTASASGWPTTGAAARTTGSTRSGSATVPTSTATPWKWPSTWRCEPARPVRPAGPVPLGDFSFRPLREPSC